MGTKRSQDTGRISFSFFCLVLLLFPWEKRFGKGHHLTGYLSRYRVSEKNPGLPFFIVNVFKIESDTF